MEIYISTYENEVGSVRWYGETPNSELRSLMNTLPVEDSRNSLAIERTGRGICRLAIKHLRAQDDCLLIDQLEEHEARCLARAYLLKREEMRTGIAACIHGQGSAAEADMPQLERALRACMELVPVQTDAPPKYQKLILPITPDATQETAERLRAHRLINGAGLRVIISDFYSVEDLKDEDIDAALCGTCPVGEPSGANGGSKLLWFALGAALLIGAIVYLSSGSSKPTDPKDSPVQQPRPTAAQEGKQGVDEHVESKNTEHIYESNMKNLKDIKEIYSCFIELRLEDLKEAKNGNKLDQNDISKLCELIIEFTNEHFGDVPEAFYQKLNVVPHALMENKQPPFRTGGVVCPDLFSSLSSFINSFLSSSDKVIIKTLFKKIVEEQLDEMWPEYKDRWKD